MKNTQDKKSNKELIAETKKAFLSAVKDKKRWLVCLAELLIAAVLLAIDLLTKHFIYGKCAADGRINIIEGVICFEAVKNTGASFGIFAGKTTALTVVSAICAFVLLIFLFYSYPRRNPWLRSALVLILAGAVGNIVDRIALGYVRDFIYFELIDFAVFNFADSCLTVGTIVLIIYVIFFYSKDEKEAQEKKRRAAQPLSETARSAEISAESAAEEGKQDSVAGDKDLFCEPKTDEEKIDE